MQATRTTALAFGLAAMCAAGLTAQTQETKTTTTTKVKLEGGKDVSVTGCLDQRPDGRYSLTEVGGRATWNRGATSLSPTTTYPSTLGTASKFTASLSPTATARSGRIEDQDRDRGRDDMETKVRPRARRPHTTCRSRGQLAEDAGLNLRVDSAHRRRIRSLSR